MTASSSKWLKANAIGLVTLLSVLLAGAVAYGTTSADISATTESVVELRSDSRVATAERAEIRSDIRVVETRQQAMLDRFERLVSRLETWTTKVGP